MGNKRRSRPLSIYRNDRSYRPWWIPTDGTSWDEPAYRWLDGQGTCANWLRRRGSRWYQNTDLYPVVLDSRKGSSRRDRERWHMLSEAALKDLEKLFPYRELCQNDRISEVLAWASDTMPADWRFFTRDTASRDITEIGFLHQEDHVAYRMVWK